MPIENYSPPQQIFKLLEPSKFIPVFLTTILVIFYVNYLPKLFFFLLWRAKPRRLKFFSIFTVIVLLVIIIVKIINVTKHYCASK